MFCDCTRILSLSSLDDLPDHICDDVAAASLEQLGGSRPERLRGYELLAAVKFTVAKGSVLLYATKGGLSIPLEVPTRIPRFGEPIFSIESVGHVAELEEAKLKLYRWYLKELLGKPLRTGRPRGTGMFENAEAFKAVFGQAVRELRRKGQNPTTGNVLRALRTKLGEVDRAQLTRWHQSLGWRTWRDFLNDVS